MVRLLRSTAKRVAERDGQAMVETALIIPFFLLLLFAIINFGLAFARYQLVANAAREGAREATLFRSPCKDSDIIRDVRTAVNRFTGRLGVQDGQLIPTVTGRMLGASSDSTGPLCDADTLNVRVEYTNSFGVLGSLAPDTPLGSTVLRSATTMTNERRAIPGAGSAPTSPSSGG